MDRPLPLGRRCPSWRRRTGNDRGQALVEFVTVVPILLLILLASVDLSRAYFALQVVGNASREGARSGILPTTSGAQVNTAVNARLTAGGLTAAPAISVTGVDGAAPGDLTTVTVSYPFATLTGSIIPGWSGTVTLSQTTVMRHE
ncbi:MAG: TadE/TadG family type IV pilus assembly protein [Nitrospinota bacterium]